MFEEFEHLEKNTVPSEILPHQVHEILAGFEPQILAAIQLLEALENWVSHKKLLELINLTKNELYCTFEDPYTFLEVYKTIEKMKQRELDILPEDFKWYNDFIEIINQVSDLIQVPMKLIFLHKFDKEYLALELVKDYTKEDIPRELIENKKKEIQEIRGSLYRMGQEKEIGRLACICELFYPTQEGF